MNRNAYPSRQVFFYSFIGGMAVSLLLMEVNWQILKWAEEKQGYIREPSGMFAHLLEILSYATVCVPLILIAATVFVMKQVYREKRGCYITLICASTVFLLIVGVAWAFNMADTYLNEGRLWMPPPDFASAMAYVWLWLCICIVMLTAWLAGTPKSEPPVSLTARLRP